MPLSTQHKIYLGVLCVAGVGLLADRTLFSPDQAVADMTDEYVVGGSDDEATAAEPHLSLDSAQRHSVAKRLVTAASENQVNPLQVRDIFTPVAGIWRPVAVEAEPVEEDVVISSPSPSAVNFTHRVTAVMGGTAANAGTGGYAIVNGRCIRIGQSIGGWTLQSVGASTATFKRDGVHVTLDVLDRAGSGLEPSKSEN